MSFRLRADAVRLHSVKCCLLFVLSPDIYQRLLVPFDVTECMLWLV